MLKVVALTLVALTTCLVPVPPMYNAVCKVAKTEVIDTGYLTTLVDEDGNAFLLVADHDLTGQWINADMDSHSTRTKEDDVICGWEILEDD